MAVRNMLTKHLRICNIWVLIIVVCAQSYLLNADIEEKGSYSMPSRILQDQNFWKAFSDEVLNRKTWKCPFHKEILTEDIEKDAELYKDKSIFLNRRKGVEQWLKNDTRWAEVVYGASKELANGSIGEYTQELMKYNIMEALEDYIQHLHYFKVVAEIMDKRGKTVVVNSQRSSMIHDIDKLDPVMLVGYSERFEDNKTTSLWEKCVYRHTHINPHHQAHCIWQDCCQNHSEIQCKIERTISLREMVCDKVSRRLQKIFGGKISKNMWDVEMFYYNGLPKECLDEAEALMNEMKDWDKE